MYGARERLTGPDDGEKAWALALRFAGGDERSHEAQAHLAWLSVVTRRLVYSRADVVDALAGVLLERLVLTGPEAREVIRAIPETRGNDTNRRS